MSTLPKSRLNMIARRKLSKLGIPTMLSADAQVLEAELTQTFGLLVHPWSRERIERVRFRVEGHDHAVFLEPSVLRGLAPLPFFELRSAQELVGAIAAALTERTETLARLAARLKQLGFLAEVHKERGVVVMKHHLNPTIGAVMMEGDPRGMFVVQLVPSGPNEPRVELGRVPIDFAAFADRGALELMLARVVEDARSAKPAARARVPSSSSSSSPGVVAATGDLVLELATADLAKQAVGSGAGQGFGGNSGVIELKLDSGDLTAAPKPPVAAAAAAAAPRSLTLGLVTEKLGSAALLGAGVTIATEISAGNNRKLRFEAKHVEGLTFAGRAMLGEVAVWSERFDLEQFPGLEAFARSLLSTPPPAEPAKPRLPLTGETWVMHVLIESDDGDEVRYVGLDAQNRPCGSMRTLAKPQFLSSFQEYPGGHRLLAKILARTADTVTYVLLDPRSAPLEASRTVPVDAFVAQLRPED